MFFLTQRTNSTRTLTMHRQNATRLHTHAYIYIYHMHMYTRFKSCTVALLYCVTGVAPVDAVTSRTDALAR